IKPFPRTLWFPPFFRLVMGTQSARVANRSPLLPSSCPYSRRGRQVRQHFLRRRIEMTMDEPGEIPMAFWQGQAYTCARKTDMKRDLDKALLGKALEAACDGR